MTPPPCLCKVDCGTFQGFSPFLILAAAAALITFLVATAAIQKERRVLQATPAQFQREATSNSSSSNSSSKEESSNSDSDSDGDNLNLPDIASRAISPARLRADVESRLLAFRRDQDATLHQFQANNHRQRRLIAERTTADSGRLTSAVDDLRQRLVEN